MSVDPASSKKRAVRNLNLRLVSVHVTTKLLVPSAISPAENVAHRAVEVLIQKLALMGPASQHARAVSISHCRQGKAQEACSCWHLASVRVQRPRA